MRIAFVVGQFPLLSETFVLSQITGMIDRGHQVTVFAHRPTPKGKIHPDVTRYELSRVTCYWPPSPRSLRELSSLSLRLARRLASWAASKRLAGLGALLRSLDPRLPGTGIELAQMALVALEAGPFDVILCHFGHVALEVERLRELGAITGKLVTVFHAYDLTVLLGEQGEGVYEQLFRQGDLFLPISRHWKQRLTDLGCPQERLAVHHMGIDTGRFPFAERRLEAGEDVTLVSVARLVEKKGLEHAIRAVATLRDRKLPVSYTIAGDGPLRAQLQGLTRELGLDREVKLLGPIDQDEVGRLLSKADVLVAPSVTAKNGDQEGIPVSIMEGMALGLPVVSTWHSGISELVDDGVSGYLVPEGDSDMLADRIGRLIAEPQRRADMGHAGRRIVERDFDVDRLNDQLADRLESLLPGSVGS